MRGERSGWPIMVQLGLLGIPSRGMAWAFFWFSFALAIVCIGLGFVDWRLFLGGGFVFAALWYYLAIRWVDRHGAWDVQREKDAADWQ